MAPSSKSLTGIGIDLGLGQEYDAGHSKRFSANSIERLYDSAVSAQIEHVRWLGGFPAILALLAAESVSLNNHPETSQAFRFNGQSRPNDFVFE